MQQYFVKGQAEPIVEIADKDTLKHMFSVMRLDNGDKLVLVFDDHIKRLSRVLDREKHLFEVIETLDSNVELPIDVTIAVGFPKGDKLEFIAQKVTELGAAQVWAYPADWSVVRWDKKKLAKKADKLEKIIQGAAEQSKRNRIPQLNLFERQSDFFDSISSFDKVLIAYEESAKAGETATFAKEMTSITPGERLLFIFGPEGGISPDEIEILQSLGGQKIGLGPRIMRAETAPLYVLSAVSYALELMKK
jgi:16S rRNA (uracil1498-N3)-methyltransferase